jgi:hypothetical protein
VPKSAEKSRRRPRAKRLRLGIERLEDRNVPAVITWNTALAPFGGDWDTALNWVGLKVPTINDDVIISGLKAGAQITHALVNADGVHSVTSNVPLLFLNGSLAIAGASTLSQLNLIGGSLNIASSLTISGLFSWSGGGLAGAGLLQSTGNFNINGPLAKGLDALTILNEGTTVWQSGSIAVTNAPVFMNAPGAAFFDEANGSFAASFINQGEFLTTATANSQLGAFQNTGFVFLPGGALSVSTFTQSAGASIQLSGGTLTTTSFTQLGGDTELDAGAIQAFGFYQDAGTVNMFGGTLGTNEYVLAAGSLGVNGGKLTTGDFNQSSGSCLINGGSLTTNTLEFASGQISDVQGMLATGTYTQTNGIMLVAGGTFILTDGTVGPGTVEIVSGNWQATNFTANGSTILIAGGTSQIASFSMFAGTASIEGGSLTATTFTLTQAAAQMTGGVFIANVYDQVSGSTLLQAGQLRTGQFTLSSGTFEVDAAGFLNTSAFTQSNGSTTTLVGGTIQTATAAQMGGVLTGSGLIIGDIVNSGTITLGKNDVLTIHGNYTEGTGGVLILNVADVSDVAEVVVTGTVNLDGTINALIINGFQPTVNQSFTLMTFGGRLGDFAQKQTSFIIGNVILQFQYTAGSLLLVAASPPPSAPPGSTTIPPEAGATVAAIVGQQQANPNVPINYQTTGAQELVNTASSTEAIGSGGGGAGFIIIAKQTETTFSVGSGSVEWADESGQLLTGELDEILHSLPDTVDASLERSVEVTADAIARGLLTGSTARAAFLPQQGSQVAPIATLLIGNRKAGGSRSFTPARGSFPLGQLMIDPSATYRPSRPGKVSRGPAKRTPVSAKPPANKHDDGLGQRNIDVEQLAALPAEAACALLAFHNVLEVNRAHRAALNKHRSGKPVQRRARGQRS